MSESMFTVPFDYVSHDGKTRIKAKLWTNAAFGSPEEPGPEKPKAIVQFVHGMSEYVDRYEDYAEYLVDRGFMVCGEDHVGHGDSVSSPDEYGHIPMNGGKDILIGDVHTLHRIIARCYPGVPYVLYGHSMGSFITRAYIARYGDELSACVLSGTGNVAPALSKAGRGLARFIASIKGERYHSKLIDGMGAGAYGKKIPDARTPFDWLSTKDTLVDAYISDPLCGFMFTVGGYATLLDLTGEIATPEWAGEVPDDLPILLIAGDGDPVGDMGEGVKATTQLLRDAGVQRVDEIIYPGMRHEIHNEVGNKKVYEDVIAWIEEVVGVDAVSMSVDDVDADDVPIGRHSR